MPPMPPNQLIFHNRYPFPTAEGEQQLQLLQYNTAYFNPYEVKHRKRTTRSQLLVLEASFKENRKPSSAVKKGLAQQLEMPLRNVQVWFQNRRAKDKHLAARARQRGEQEPPAPGGNSSDDDEGGDQANDGPKPTADDRDAEPPSVSSPPSKSSPPAAETSNPHLLPPTSTVNNHRRGSAPVIGLGYPTQVDPSPHHLQATTSHVHRVVSDTIAVSPPSLSDAPEFDIHSSTLLARRRSLPAFHEAHQHHLQLPNSSHFSSLPTISDLHQLVEGDESQGSSQPMLSPPVKFGSTSSTSYPPATRNNFTSMNFRSGSTPGLGVFRVPTNPVVGGWYNPSSTGERELNINSPVQPFTFPPRRVSDLPSGGPLPRADFSFGSSEDSNNHNQVYQDGVTPRGDDDNLSASRRASLAQNYRFGSFASDFSVESDATGTTATTATSSVGYTNGPFPASTPATSTSFNGMGRYGMANGFAHGNSAPFAAPVSYGYTSGSVAGLSAGPVHFPQGFDPDMRRASCPAHFVDQFAHFGVEGTASAVPLPNLNPRFLVPTIKTSPSSHALGKHPLRMSIRPPPPPGQLSQEAGGSNNISPQTVVMTQYPTNRYDNSTLDFSGSVIISPSDPHHPSGNLDADQHHQHHHLASGGGSGSALLTGHYSHSSSLSPVDSNSRSNSAEAPGSSSGSQQPYTPPTTGVSMYSSNNPESAYWGNGGPSSNTGSQIQLSPVDPTIPEQYATTAFDPSTSYGALQGGGNGNGYNFDPSMDSVGYHFDNPPEMYTTSALPLPTQSYSEMLHAPAPIMASASAPNLVGKLDDDRLRSNGW